MTRQMNKVDGNNLLVQLLKRDLRSEFVIKRYQPLLVLKFILRTVFPDLITLQCNVFNVISFEFKFKFCLLIVGRYFSNTFFERYFTVTLPRAPQRQNNVLHWTGKNESRRATIVLRSIRRLDRYFYFNCL